MKQFFTCIFFLSFLQTITAQDKIDSFAKEEPIVLHTATGDIYGVLMIPNISRVMPLALLIAGSGPTDRDGNNPYTSKIYYLQQLAAALAKQQVATLRFDKRGVAASTAAMKSEAELRFTDYVNDVTEWISLLKKDKRFSSITIVGHSEGSLIGMLAKGADKFVSIAGAGRPAYEILEEQLNAQSPKLKDMAMPLLDSLKNGFTVKSVSPFLINLFRPSVQPYLISWFQYAPAAVIHQLTIPILIIQGTNDLQVAIKDAQRLKDSAAAAKLMLIKDMNHIFRTVTGSREDNIKTYSDATLSLNKELAEVIVTFIKTKERYR